MGRSTLRAALKIAIAAGTLLWLAACTTPAEKGVASECGPNLSAAQSCKNWYSGGS
ncbi:MAG TPA: hypothetical protein VEG27_07130 [Usitatibacter sp.]|nr:hypothetical protein [Usitatibacter sp.]